MRIIKAKQRLTMSESHPTCTKANERALEAPSFRVNVELHRISGVGALDFLAIFGKYFDRNGLRVDVTMSVVMDSVTSMPLDGCANVPGIRDTHRRCMKMPSGQRR